MKLRPIHGIVGAAVLVAAAGLATYSFADGHAAAAITERKALMKSVGGAAGVVGKMLKGEMAYDAAAAKEALGKMEAAGKAYNEKYADLFPAGSDAGETGASAAVFAKADEFKAKAAAFATDAAAAAAAPDEAGFKAAAGKVFGNCQGCHETFRKPQ